MIEYIYLGFLGTFLIAAIQDWKTHHVDNILLATMWLAFLGSMILGDVSENAGKAYLMVPLAFSFIFFINELRVIWQKKVIWGWGDLFVLPLWLSSVFFFTTFQFSIALSVLLTLPWLTYLVEFMYRRLVLKEKRKVVKIALLPHLFFGTLIACLISAF